MDTVPQRPVKAPRKHTTPRTRTRVVAALNAGKTAKQVGADEGLSSHTVYGIRKRFSHQDWGKSPATRGRPAKLDERDKRVILRIARADPGLPTEELRRQACPNVHISTLRNYLAAAGFKHVKKDSQGESSEEALAA